MYGKIDGADYGEIGVSMSQMGGGGGGGVPPQ